MNFHSPEAEQQVLGMIMCSPEAFDLIGDILKPEHFGDPFHGFLFETLGRRIANGHLVSPPAMAGVLDQNEALRALGGPAYLVRCAGSAISASAARDYAKLIIEHCCRRALDVLSAQAQLDLAGGKDSGDVKSALLMSISALPEASGEETSVSLLKAVGEAVQGAVQAYQGGTSYLKTGLGPLDKILRGLAPGDVCLIGGATSMGKTSLALEIAGNVAIEQNRGVCFISLEMSRQELATRMASSRSRVPYTDLRNAADMEENDFRKWIEASNSISQAPMRIIPKHVRDLPTMLTAARKVSREIDLSLLVVDYAQLVRSPGKGRYEQMTEVSIGLKSLAGLLGVPVIALCQLSRTIGDRDDKRPQLNDIKETGQFENDADQVVFCHREGYWMQRQGPTPDKTGFVSDKAKQEWQADLAGVQNVMELIVRKNRHGRLGTAQVGFHDATGRFWTLGERNDVQEEF